MSLRDDVEMALGALLGFSDGRMELLSQLRHFPVRFLVVLPHLLHKEFDVLLRCRHLRRIHHAETL